VTGTSLDSFITATRSAWGPLSTGLVATCRTGLERLVRADPSEVWLAALLRDRPAARELHRDTSGFMLLAHNEHEGLYRPPHDHGRAWVVYAVQSGALEIRTYGLIASAEPRLVLRDTSVLKAGEARAYLPGDIHDTRCLSEDALLFRFTERDLRHEDQVERKLARFIERDGYWTMPR
jgi:hypothetical protein